MQLLNFPLGKLREDLGIKLQHIFQHIRQHEQPTLPPSNPNPNIGLTLPKPCWQQKHNILHIKAIKDVK